MKPIQYEVRISNYDWSLYFGDIIIEPQRFGQFDTDSCWDASSYKGGIDIQCNFLLKNNLFPQVAVTFFTENGYLDVNGSMRTSERFSEIISGIRDNGSTAQEAAELFQEYGCIPWSMLHYTDAQAAQWATQEQFDADYFNPATITPAMLALGKKFLNYVNIAYQRIGVEFTTPAQEILIAALKQAPLQYGIAINSNTASWNQVNVPAPDNNNMAHEVTGYTINPDGSYPIVDNYAPFTKVLASNYPILSVIQIIITAIPDTPTAVIQDQAEDSFLTKVMNFWNNIFYPGNQVGKIAPKGI